MRRFLIVTSVCVGSLALGVGAVVGTLIFAPDGLLEHF